jgi:predicted nucleic acid-binding protein
LSKLDRGPNSQRLIIVPTAVLVETVNVLGKKSGHRVALETANEIMRPEGRFLLEEVGPYLERALEKFGQQPTGVSLTDCVVMATADHYDTLEIFGFDKQFADAGYRRLRPSDEWNEAA